MFVFWKTCCTPWSLGGLGIKHLNYFIEALLIKLAWNVLTKQFFVFDILRDRYKGKDNKRCYDHIMDDCCWILGN